MLDDADELGSVYRPTLGLVATPERFIEALPPPIDCVPAVVKAVGSKATVLFDSGVRSGTDVARALAGLRSRGGR